MVKESASMSDGKTDQKSEGLAVGDFAFAVTLERKDRAAVLAMARELDRPGMGKAATTFAFFTRTSLEFCNAIIDKNVPNRIAMCGGNWRGSMIIVSGAHSKLRMILGRPQRYGRKNVARAPFWTGLTPARNALSSG
jgi:hypothetical protein